MMANFEHVEAENERLRKALGELHEYGLAVSGAADAYGEKKSEHLWLEVAAIAEAALWPRHDQPACPVCGMRHADPAGCIDGHGDDNETEE